LASLLFRMNFLPLKQERTGTDAQAQTHTQTHTKENHSRGIGSQNWQNRYTKKKKGVKKKRKETRKERGKKSTMAIVVINKCVVSNLFLFASLVLSVEFDLSQ